MRGGLANCWTILRLVNLRHFRERKRRTALTIVGLSGGVALLIAITLINETLRKSIDAEARGLAGGAALQVVPAGPVALAGSVSPVVGRTQGVKDAVPFLEETTRVRGGRGSARLLVLGASSNLPALFPEGLGEVAHQLAEPRFARGEVILAGQLARAIGARPGGYIELETAHGYVRARVGALLGRGPFASVNGGDLAVMALPAAQRVFGQGDRVSGVYVTARAGWSTGELRAALRTALRGGATIQPPGGGAQAYERTFDSIASISQESRAVGLAVAFFLVLSTMSMSLTERRGEITLLRLQGATETQVVCAFLVEAALLGLVASVLGIAGGAALAHVLLQRAVDSYNILPITASGPVVIRPQDALLGLVGGIAVTTLGAALPAARILGVAPIDALRPEASYEWRARTTVRMPRVLIWAGAGAIGASTLLVLLAPVGSNVVLAGAALVGTLAGAAMLLPWVTPLLAAVVGRALSAVAGFSGRFARDALAAAPGRTILAVGGLAMATSFVVAVASSIGSYRVETERAAAVWYGAPLYVNAAGSAAYISDQPLPISLASRLAATPGVKAVYPMRFGLVDSNRRQLVIYALPVAQAARAGDRITGSLGISEAKLVRGLRRHEVVISRLTARRHHLAAGDRLVLPTASGPVRVRIAALFDDIASFDSVFLEQSFYAHLTGDRTADRFAIVLDPGADARIVARRLRRIIDAAGIPASVLTRRQMAGYLVDAIQSLFSVAEGIEVAALLVAALIVFNTMLTTTFERSREFGLLRLAGMSSRGLGASVVLESAAIAVAGAILAVALGLGLGFLITISIEDQLAWRVSFAPSATATLTIVLVTSLLCVLAALYPSWIATRQTLIELLRFE